MVGGERARRTWRLLRRFAFLGRDLPLRSLEVEGLVGGGEEN